MVCVFVCVLEKSFQLLAFNYHSTWCGRGHVAAASPPRIIRYAISFIQKITIYEYIRPKEYCTPTTTVTIKNNNEKMNPCPTINQFFKSTMNNHDLLLFILYCHCFFLRFSCFLNDIAERTVTEFNATQPISTDFCSKCVIFIYSFQFTSRTIASLSL